MKKSLYLCAFALTYAGAPDIIKFKELNDSASELTLIKSNSATLKASFPILYYNTLMFFPNQEFYFLFDRGFNYPLNHVRYNANLALAMKAYTENVDEETRKLALEAYTKKAAEAKLLLKHNNYYDKNFPIRNIDDYVPAANYTISIPVRNFSITLVRFGEICPFGQDGPYVGTKSPALSGGHRAYQLAETLEGQSVYEIVKITRDQQSLFSEDAMIDEILNNINLRPHLYPPVLLYDGKIIRSIKDIHPTQISENVKIVAELNKQIADLKQLSTNAPSEMLAAISQSQKQLSLDIQRVIAEIQPMHPTQTIDDIQIIKTQVAELNKQIADLKQPSASAPSEMLVEIEAISQSQKQLAQDMKRVVVDTQSIELITKVDQIALQIATMNTSQQQLIQNMQRMLNKEDHLTKHVDTQQSELLAKMQQLIEENLAMKKRLERLENNSSIASTTLTQSTK